MKKKNKNDTIAQQTLFEPKNMKKDPNKIWNEKIKTILSRNKLCLNPKT